MATGRGRVPGWVSGFDIQPISDMPFGRGILANLGQESFCFCFPSSAAGSLREDVVPSLSSGVLQL